MGDVENGQNCSYRAEKNTVDREKNCRFFGEKSRNGCVVLGEKYEFKDELKKIPCVTVQRAKEKGRLAQVKDFIFYWIICRRLINHIFAIHRNILESLQVNWGSEGRSELLSVMQKP